MAQPAQKKHIVDPKTFQTLHQATRRYKLREKTKNMTNDELAAHLQLGHQFGDHMGLPNCCFFFEGCIVAIRTQHDEVSIFHLFERFGHRMEDIADKVE